MARVQELAGVAAGSFEVAVRMGGSGAHDDDRETFTRVKDGAPAWVGELVRAAHGTDADADGAPSMLPDDWRYACTRAACEAISEASDPEDGHDGHEFADGYVDVYDSERIAWLGSHSSRVGYCDEAREDSVIAGKGGIVEAIGLGQYMEAAEVYGLVYGFLAEMADEGAVVSIDV